MTKAYDFAIIGGGLLGLATAHALMQRDKRLRIAVLEKEDKIARHQSGRNSGVIHSGIYYKPGSLKAQLTARGRQALFEFCDRRGITYERCGKVILASDEEELPRLEALAARAEENGLEAQVIDQRRLAEIEPHAKALAAIWLPQTAIVDFSQVAHALAEDLADVQVDILPGSRVKAIEVGGQHSTLSTTQAEIRAEYVINCAGLHSDQVARMLGLRPQARIIPFRGQYFGLKGQAKDLVRGLIYPLPDPKYPFLGVHLTRMMNGEVLAGPNAVLSLKREGYHSADFDLADSISTLTFPGFWRLAAANLGVGLAEILRAWRVEAFAREVQRMLPAVTAADLAPARAGVRAQAVDRTGNLLNDFHFERGANSLHVINAPSPGATACLAIGEHIAKEALMS